MKPASAGDDNQKRHSSVAASMCQLFALNSLEPAAVTFAFTGFSARGGATDRHADGFGLAFHEGSACRRFVDHARAADSVLADFLRTHPIRARTVLAHIRKATQGPVQLSNCHPFVREWQGREWSFCHNGDLKEFHPKLDGSHLPVGQTDSERAFCWILQKLRRRFRRAAPGWEQLAPAIAELAEDIAAHGKFNFLLSDGRSLYAFGATRLHWLQRRHPFGTAHLVDHDLELDLATTNGPDDRMVLVATEPLTRNEAWQPFAAGELRVFVDGEQVWRHAASRAAASAAMTALVMRPA
jgi:predicted glutamine amidotransferase